MREIKFRAWTGKQMFNVDVLAISKCTWGCPDRGYQGVSLAFQPTIKVMQYLGVTDTTKNRRPIYEDDIVLCNDEHVGVISYNTDDDYPAFDVDFGKHQYGSDECNNISYFKATGSIEVIGNIYEHPDLLTEELKRWLKI